jgi:uncharacterized protein (UPF0264 family)
VRLLVSVRDATEARAALAGGADLVVGVGGLLGAIGAVAPATLRAIVRAVDGRRPVSAALGDAGADAQVARAARAAAECGVAFVKAGFRAVASVARATALARAAAAGLADVPRAEPGAPDAPARLVLVGYADAALGGGLSPMRVVDVAYAVGAAGVLVDTALKDGGGLFALMTRAEVRAWIDAAHAAGLVAALAGKLRRDDVRAARALGADIAGVRGAACDGGREGRVSRARVKALAAVVSESAGDRLTGAGTRSDEFRAYVAEGTR